MTGTVGPLVIAAALLVAGAAEAFPTSFLLAGIVARGGEPVNGPVHVVVALHADATDGVPIYVGETDAIALEGLLVLDVGGDGTLDIDLLAAPELFAELTVDDDAMTPRIPVPAAALALRATLADLADLANDAAQFADVLPANIATRSALAESGGAAVAFANLTGLPTGVADGDADTLYSPGAGVALDNGNRFFLAQIPAASFQAGAVTRGAIESVSADDIASGAFTDADFDAAHTVDVYAAALGCTADAALSTRTTCRRGSARIDGVVCTAGTLATCDGLSCAASGGNCPTTPAGRLVFAP